MTTFIDTDTEQNSQNQFYMNLNKLVEMIEHAQN